MKCLVTGVAGFVGSTIAVKLRELDHDVVGVDCVTTYYDPTQKRANLRDVVTPAGVLVREDDLLEIDLDELFDGVDTVFHQAGQPGVRASWADGFAEYADLNILVTQRLLEAAHRVGVQRFVFASSSSVYGNADRYPTTEDMLPRPHSPYGVSKLAAEHMCSLYGENFGVPTISLRYFTVYGPRQRPDMAMHRLIEAAIDGKLFPLYGDGTQIRDFTFVGDVVDANLGAMTAGVAPGSVYNVCGGGETTMNEVIAMVEELVGARVNIDRRPAAAGDVQRTGGDSSKAYAELGWSPSTSVFDGLREQVAWHLARRR